ncbi:ASST-domain-containing protein [Mycena crocata]|nr:ASST-domain-containing protein [Mycena crocata]
MPRLSTFTSFLALSISSVAALFETTCHSSSLEIQPFNIVEKSPLYDPDNTTLFLVCPLGLIVAQPGPTMYTAGGDLVWSDPSLANCNDLNLQTFDGQQYLTLWPANKTVLATAFHPIPLDLTSVGGPQEGWYLNSIIQEIDIASGEILFNWTSIDHIALNESYNNISVTGQGNNSSDPWDPVHINSIDKDRDGNYLISARNCQTIYKLDKNGTIIWRLGGKASDFTAQSDDVEFHWQHHARWRMDETQISLFDDGAAIIETSLFIDEPVASGKYLKVDQSEMTVSLAKKFSPSPSTNNSFAAGGIEPYGDTVVVGYGSLPWVQVYDLESEAVLFSAVIGPNNPALWLGGVGNYRVFQTSTLEFTGHPAQPPNVSVTGDDLYVSWNGATHVASYTLLTGKHPDSVSREVRKVWKSGFETKMSAVGSSTFISVAALAANGTTLGTSAVYKASDGSVVG